MTIIKSTQNDRCRPAYRKTGQIGTYEQAEKYLRGEDMLHTREQLPLIRSALRLEITGVGDIVQAAVRWYLVEPPGIEDK